MTTSPSPSVLNDVLSGGPLPDGTREYLRQRVRQSFFTYIREKLADAEKHGLTRTELALRMGKGKANLSHLLAMPGNWTLDTYTDFLLGIAQEEPVPASKHYAGRGKSNHGPVIPREPTQFDPPSAGAGSSSRSHIIQVTPK